MHTSTPATPPPLDAPPALRAPGRGARLLAAAIDGSALLAATAAAFALATVWLFVRTSAGRDDVGDGDAVLATSLVAAAPAAWAVWLALAAARGATPGEARANLRVAAPRGRALLRLALRPLAVLGWAWLALLALAAGLTPLATALLVIAGLVALGGLGSLALWLVRPEARALHDRLAGTRLVRRS